MRGLVVEMDSIKQDNSIAENKTERVEMDSRTGSGRKVIPDGMCQGAGLVSPMMNHHQLSASREIVFHILFCVFPRLSLKL